MTKLVDGLQRNNEIEAGSNTIDPVLFFEICLNKNHAVCEFCETVSAELLHLRGEIKQGVAHDITIIQQSFGEKARSTAQLKDRQGTLLFARSFVGESLE